MRADHPAVLNGPASLNRLGLVIRDLRSPIRGPFNADFPSGECTIIQGASGAGKSLFLRMVADLDPNTGTVLLDGVERTTVPAPLWRRWVTYVAAEPGFWADSLGEHMADRSAARRLLPEVGLDPALLEAPVARLSTGERQRAGLIRAVVGGPRVLLLDEPTSALDEGARTRVEAMLGHLKSEGVGLVIVSHDPAQARRLGDRQFRLGSTGLEDVS
jgi:putative ABC transport system ATP-binding protein